MSVSGWFGVALLEDFGVRNAVTIDVDRDEATESALATFVRDGQVRGSMSLWLDGDTIEGFILRGVSSGLEIVVRDLAVLAREPTLGSVVKAVCRAGNLRLPGSSTAIS